MRAYVAIPGAAIGFFFSSWLAMLLWGVLAPDLGLETINYVKAMVVTISLWLVVAPLAGAIAGRRVWWQMWEHGERRRDG